MDDLGIKISDKFFVKLAEKKKSKNQEKGKKLGKNNKKLICYCLSAVASRVCFLASSFNGAC